MTEEAKPVAVLLAEDEALVRMVAADILIEAGYRVLEAVSADEALSMLEARSDIQVLITDVEMPGALNGFALARLVHRSWPRIGIVVVSGRQAPAPGELPHSAVYLLKPYTPDKLVGAVRSVLPREAEPIVVEPERVEVPVLPISAVLSSRPGAEGVSGGLAQPLPEPPDE